MVIDEKTIITQVVEAFVRTGDIAGDAVKVIRLPDNKTSVIEQHGGEGRSVMLDEFKVDGRTIWAGYSGRSGTVYLSATTSR